MKWGKYMTVLIVEDTAILRKILRDILVEFCGIPTEDIYEAADGEKAITEYERLKPDVVFLDIAMPKLNGKEAIKMLRAINPPARIIMCTSSREEHDVMECIRAGAKDYLAKPLQPQRVKEAIIKVAADMDPSVLPDAIK